MPFPTYQGTQAAIRSMLEALTSHHRKPHLLVYAQSGYGLEPKFAVHRLSERFPQSSLRSGPSLAKCLLDCRFTPALRRLQHALQPNVVVAHHVEAAAAALVARSRPLVFFAHTDLGAELPTYVGGSLRACRATDVLCARAGHWTDRYLSLRADAVAVISPELRQRLSAFRNEISRVDSRPARTRAWARSASRPPRIMYVPTPWPVLEPVRPQERERARRCLGFGPDQTVVAYAGNLDGYQGWEAVVHAVRLASVETPRLRLLCATASDPTPLWLEAGAAGIAHRVRVVGLAGKVVDAPDAASNGAEQVRRAVHAAADAVVVPRRVSGGFPIKMLDALARGVPVVAAKQATAGLAIGRSLWLARTSDARALASGIRAVCSSPRLSGELRERGPAYVASHHSAEQFVEHLDRVCESARNRFRPSG